MRGVILICCALVFLLPSSDGTAPAPVADDVLSQAYQADRVGRVAMLREMDATEFTNNKDKAEWHLERSRALLGEAYRPYLDAVAQAIVDGKVVELAESLEPK